MKTIFKNLLKNSADFTVGTAAGFLLGFTENYLGAVIQQTSKTQSFASGEAGGIGYGLTGGFVSTVFSCANVGFFNRRASINMTQISSHIFYLLASFVGLKEVSNHIGYEITRALGHADNYSFADLTHNGFIILPLAALLLLTRYISKERERENPIPDMAQSLLANGGPA